MSRGPIPDKDKNRPTVPEVLTLVDEYRARAENIAGGNLHVVIEDTNINDGNIQFCLDLCLECEDELGAEIARKMLQMTSTQRREIVFHGGK